MTGSKLTPSVINSPHSDVWSESVCQVHTDTHAIPHKYKSLNRGKEIIFYIKELSVFSFVSFNQSKYF